MEEDSQNGVPPLDSTAVEELEVKNKEYYDQLKREAIQLAVINEDSKVLSSHVIKAKRSLRRLQRTQFIFLRNTLQIFGSLILGIVVPEHIRYCRALTCYSISASEVPFFLFELVGLLLILLNMRAQMSD